MNVISRIQFPITVETSSLYMKCNEGASIYFDEEHTEVALTKNGVLSFNTYFNSFYEKFYAKYTVLKSLYYLLKLAGDFEVSIYRESENKDNRVLIHIENFEKCQLSTPVKILLPDSWQSEESGRVYLEIRCLSEQGSFIGGLLTTDQPKTREISLGIVTCTFKKEAYVKKTTIAICKDKLLQNKKLKLFVVDNGRSLNKDDFQYQKLQLISNGNVGGSGGFTRGLIEALQEDIYTHFLFMDDDIELETESVYRLFSLYEYAKQDFAIAGSMLDLYKKHMLYEAGALYGKGTDGSGNYRDCPFGVVCLNSRLNLESSTSINLLLSEQKPDYGGFWFFSFSKETVQAIGLPLPFFIKIDDMEFGLRIKERLGNAILYFPGIAIWHEPFYAKHPGWDTYYEFRNHMITHSIRGSLTYIKAVKFLTKSLVYKLFIFDYNSTEMIIKSLEDYLQGPAFIQSHDPESFHSKILELSKSHKTQTVQSKTLNFPENIQFQLILKHKKNTIKRIFGLLTLNGHLLPKFVMSADEAIYCVDSNHVGEPWYNVFGKKRVVILREGNNKIIQNEISNLVGIGILIRWFLIVIKSAIRWSSVRSEWKNAFKDFTSMEFWKEYLKLNEQT